MHKPKFLGILQVKKSLFSDFDGDRIVVSFGRHWWVDQDGDLIGMVDESDITELKKLTQSGIFERVTITH